MLDAYKRAFSDEIKVFQLQRRVTGVEVAVGAFFNGKQFVYPVNINFEHKKLFPGSLGPPTGEMGTSMFWSPPNQLFNQTLLKMESKLAEEGYVGYIDVNCIVNGNGIYPLEFTSRFGYPTISIQQAGNEHSHRSVFLGSGRGHRSQVAGKEWFSKRSANRSPTLSLRRHRRLSSLFHETLPLCLRNRLRMSTASKT